LYEEFEKLGSKRTEAQREQYAKEKEALIAQRAADIKAVYEAEIAARKKVIAPFANESAEFLVGGRPLSAHRDAIKKLASEMAEIAEKGFDITPSNFLAGGDGPGKAKLDSF